MASKKAWATLSPADQAAIRQAVADTRRHSGRLADREALELTQLCQQGVVLDRPTAVQLGALAQATARRADERGRGRRGKADPGAAGNRRAAGRDRDAGRMPGRGRRGDRDGDSPGPDAGLRPPGRRQDTAGHLRGDRHGGGLPAGGQYGSDWEKDITFTTLLHADGTLRETQAPDYSDQGPVSGHYVVKGDEVTFFLSQAGGIWSATEKVRWSYFDGQLTFAIVDVADTSSRVIYTAHPWRKTS